MSNSLTQTQTVPQIQLVNSDFDCGPKEPPLPSDAELQKMTDYDLFMKYQHAWQWGERCDKDLTALKDKLQAQLAARQPEKPHWHLPFLH